MALRKLAAIRGLVSHGLRSRVWPLLLGTHDQTHDAERYESLSTTPHKDSNVVDVDVARSLWAWTEGWPDGDRDDRRAALKRIINATVAGNSEDVYYYQGLHDVSAVLLFVAGEQAAYRMLRRLAACHLRDCTRTTLESSVEVLSMLYPILQAADPNLHDFIKSLGEPALEIPYFALSWHMTWFAHDVVPLDQCARLFDLFISSHPLMPLYVAAVAVRHNRAAILECGLDGGDLVYAKLKGMAVLGPGQLSADELALQAASLYKIAPPATLARRWQRKLVHSSTLEAFISDGRWQVPTESRRNRRQVGHRISLRLVAGGTRPAALAALTAIVFTGIASAAFIGTALIAVQLQMLHHGGGGAGGSGFP